MKIEMTGSSLDTCIASSQTWLAVEQSNPDKNPLCSLGYIPSRRVCLRGRHGYSLNR